MDKRTSNYLLIGFLCLLVNLPIIGQVNYPNEVVFRFAVGISAADKENFLEDYNLDTLEGPTPVTGFYRAEVRDSQGLFYNNIDSIQTIVERMRQSSNSNGGGLNYEIEGFTSIDASLPASILGNCNNSNLSITVPHDRYSVTTGVFDTGLSPSSIFSPHIDKNNTGQNFVGLNPSSDIWDTFGHGTFMASLLIKELSPLQNSLQQLMIYKTHDESGKGDLFSLLQAIDQAILDKAKVVNMSFSYYAHYYSRYDSKNPLSIAINEAKGILFIAAAGNDHNNNDGANEQSAFPASYPHDNIISVAAVDCYGQFASNFSNYGRYSVDIGAPGLNINGIALGGSAASAEGSSVAAALVTRTASMLASYQYNFDPIATKHAILCGATKDPSLINKVLTGGYLNAAESLKALQKNCSYTSSDYRILPTAQDWVSNQIENGHLTLEIASEKTQTGKVIISNLMGQILRQEEIPLIAGRNIYNWTFPNTNSSRMLYFITLQVEEQIKTIKVFR